MVSSGLFDDDSLFMHLTTRMRSFKMVTICGHVCGLNRLLSEEREYINYSVPPPLTAVHLNDAIRGFGLTTGMTDADYIAEALGLDINDESGDIFESGV